MKLLLLILFSLTFANCTDEQTSEKEVDTPAGVVDKKEEASKPTQAEIEAEQTAIKQAQAEVQAEVQAQPQVQAQATGKGRVTRLTQSSGIAFVSICDRTAQVKQVILKKLSKSDCERVTAKELPAILYLDLTNKGITSLKDGDFQGLSSLQGLYLYNNQLSSLHAGQFQGLSSLQVLNLGSNQLSSLHAGQFQGLSSLQRLYLYNNQLSSLHAGQFQGLSSLQRLDLYSNQLSNEQKAQVRREVTSRVNLRL